MPTLPALPSDPAEIMGSGGMTGGEGQPDQSSQIDVKDQAQGAVQQVGMLRKQIQETLEALTTTFPATGKAAKELQRAMDQGLQGLVREIIKTTQTPEPPAPKVFR